MPGNNIQCYPMVDTDVEGRGVKWDSLSGIHILAMTKVYFLPSYPQKNNLIVAIYLYRLAQSQNFTNWYVWLLLGIVVSTALIHG